MTRILPSRPLLTAFSLYRQRFWTAIYKSANDWLCAFIKAVRRSTAAATEEGDICVIYPIFPTAEAIRHKLSMGYPLDSGSHYLLWSSWRRFGSRHHRRVGGRLSGYCLLH